MSKLFESERTKYLHSYKLDAEEEKAVSDVEEFGCHILQVRGDEFSKGFAYTVGVHDTSGRPELIVVGLKDPVAQSALNAAVTRMRAGVDLTTGRHEDIVGNVGVEFRPVDAKWVQHLMGWDKWYYGSWEFPVLQCVYPDLEGRFHNEPDFTEYFRQPLLQPDVVKTRAEEDFWAANDAESSMLDWKFPLDPHTGVYLSKSVQSGEEAITYVCYDVDGDWQFLGDTMTESGGVLSCFHHPIDGDPSLKELADLPRGWWAERAAPGDPWVRSELEPDEEA